MARNPIPQRASRTLDHEVVAMTDLPEPILSRIYHLFQNMGIFEDAVATQRAQAEAGETEGLTNWMRKFIPDDRCREMARPFEQWFYDQPKYRAMIEDDKVMAFPSPMRKLEDHMKIVEIIDPD
jgi:hypothetical protein